MAVVIMVAILLAGFTAGFAAGHEPNDFDLYFTTGSTQDYVQHRGLSVSKAFTVCFWMRSWTTKIGTPFNYATSANDNEIGIYNSPAFSLWIGNQKRETSVTSNDGNWHHICATWSNTAGDWKIYKDAHTAAQGSGFRKGYTIPSNGVLILGQDQDTLGGGFDPTQSYEGEISQLHVWNYALDQQQINLVFQQCCDRLESGRVKSWSDFWAGVHGATRIVSPSACKRCL